MTDDATPQNQSAASGDPDDRRSQVGYEFYSSQNQPSTSSPNPTISINAVHQVPSQAEPAIEQNPGGTCQSNPNQAADDNNDSTYHLKWVPWNSSMLPIVMQSINGPCPLIATMNVLLLREKIKLPSMLEQITESQLLAYIGEIIMDSMPAEAENDENMILNLEQNINDAIEILPKLKSGLDVNIRFTGITDFEYTPECIIFDLLRIPLYHGWLSDPDLVELQNAIGAQSYNQLVDNIITNKASSDPAVATRIMIAEEFLEKTASQLTLHGLNELHRRIKDNEIGILFRNNHFLTLFKREGEIYTLVTDHGYLTEDNIVWETLDNIEGAGRFFDSNFQLSEMTNRQVSQMKAIDERQQQMVNDYLVALSLKEEETKEVGAQSTSSQRELDDLEVAKKLQAEEDRYYAEMIDKKETPQGGYSADRQVAIRPESSRDETQLQQQQQPHPSSTTQNTYAQALEKRSIWETDRRTTGEQDDSWNTELSKATADARSQPHSENLSQSPFSQPTDGSASLEDRPLHGQQQQQRSHPHQPGGGGGGSIGSSSHGASRRSRSEKSSKESNCIVQ